MLCNRRGHPMKRITQGHYGRIEPVDFSTTGNRNQHQVSECLLKPPRDECQRGWIVWFKRNKGATLAHQGCCCPITDIQYSWAMMRWPPYIVRGGEYIHTGRLGSLKGLTLCDKVRQLLATNRCFFPVSSTQKTDLHSMTEILLKVALNIINQTKPNPKRKVSFLR